MFQTQRQHPSRELSGGIVQVPTSSTDVVAVDTFLKQISVANTTAGALTITVKDKQGTPRNILPTVSIAANTVQVFNWPETIKCSGGVNWSASNTGLEAEVFGYIAG